MGLFGGNFSKPGPGIDKDAPQKKGIFLYFEIFARKFWKLIQTNLLYFGFSILFIILLYFFAPVSQAFVQRMAETAVSGGADPTLAEPTIQLGFRAMFSIGILAFWGFGPITPAYAYITRCFTREQHAWIWSDFKEKVGENFKQGIIVFIIDLLVLYLGINAVMFYFSAFQGTQQTVWLLICYVTIVALLIYTIMHYYIYQLMVTFKCTVGQLYKNAVLLAFAKLPMNLLLTAVGVVLLYLPFLLVSPAVAVVLCIVLWISVIRFPMEFYAARVIQRQILGRVSELEDKPDDRGIEE